MSRRSRLSLMLLGLLVGSALCAAAPNRVFVSARTGNDANSCGSIATPCQTFAGAVAQVGAGGAVIVLDTGGYGPVTITKSLTIEAPAGVTAFIHPPSGDAIQINAGSADVVVLRGIVMDGPGGFGLIANSVGSLYVENCVISGFNGNGGRGLTFRAPGQLFVKDTTVRQNGLLGTGAGIEIVNGRASLDHCRVEGNGSDGIYVKGADVTVRDSVSAGNELNGFFVTSPGAEASILNVYGCTSTNNGTAGFAAIGGGSGFVIARLANSSIIENYEYGLESVGATFLSLGNSLVLGNITQDVLGPVGVMPGQ